MLTIDDLGQPLDLRHLMGPQRAALVELLEELERQEWDLPTAYGDWRVRDLVAHVLGDDLWRLASQRDGDDGLGWDGDHELATFVDNTNAAWVRGARRLSPRLLIDLLRWAGDQIQALWDALDPYAEDGLPVTWAGLEDAPVWLDAARDLTEYWVHDRQLRLATGRSMAPSDPLLPYVLDVFLRALPHTLRDTDAPAGTTVEMVAGEVRWRAERRADNWTLVPIEGPAITTVWLDPDTAWRLCTRGMTPLEARSLALVEGDEYLAMAALQMVSIII